MAAEPTIVPIHKVYVAGKLNADAVGYLYNCHKMLNTAELLREAGYAPYVPCVDLIQGIMFGYETYNDYFDLSQPWLKSSDAVFLVKGWQTSSGTRKEIETAWANDIPVFDTLDEMWTHSQGVPGGAIRQFITDKDGCITGVVKDRNLPGYGKIIDEIANLGAKNTYKYTKTKRSNPYEVRD